MTASKDLDGGTHEIVVDAEETYFEILDDSVDHDGTLIMRAGSTLLLDDSVGAGFDPDWVGTFTIEGTAENPCRIKSVETNPHHPFLMALGVGGTWTQVRISGNAAFSSTGTIFPNNVRWGDDTYCSVDDGKDIWHSDCYKEAHGELSAMDEREARDRRVQRWAHYDKRPPNPYGARRIA